MRETIPQGVHHAYDRLVAPRFQRFYGPWAAEHGGPGRSLDMGCGPGHLAAAYAHMHQSDVTGLDVDPVQLRLAARVHPMLPLVQGDVHALPFRDASHDTLWATESFHHWRDPAAALAETHRVLRPGGRLLIVEGCGDITRQELSNWMPAWTLPLARAVFFRHGYSPRRLARDVLPLLGRSPFGGCTVHRRWGWWTVEARKAPA